MTTTARTYPLQRERNLILGTLILLAAAAWAVLIWQSLMMDDEDMGLTMGMGAPLFIAIWASMMVAIMFPTAAPMILTFARAQANRRERGQVFVPTWLFVSSYLALWIATGVVAYIAAAIGDSLAEDSMWVMENASRIGGAVLVLAGLYQLSPLKTTCLGKCRTPMSFILGSWRDGSGGAVRMGLEHAAYCFGCCWLLFVILFPLGMMNIAAMALITLLIFAEKSLAIGPHVAKTAAVGLIVYGALIIALPGALPTMM
jgi:predicted metal-binding membrane protein